MERGVKPSLPLTRRCDPDYEAWELEMEMVKGEMTTD
jgi:hypothetical protein